MDGYDGEMKWFLKNGFPFLPAHSLQLSLVMFSFREWQKLGSLRQPHRRYNQFLWSSLPNERIKKLGTPHSQIVTMISLFDYQITKGQKSLYHCHHNDTETYHVYDQLLWLWSSANDTIMQQDIPLLPLCQPNLTWVASCITISHTTLQTSITILKYHYIANQ